MIMAIHSHRVELCIVECRESLYSLKTMITLLLLLLLASNIPFSFGQKVSVDYDKFMVHMRNNRKKTLLENKWLFSLRLVSETDFFLVSHANALHFFGLVFMVLLVLWLLLLLLRVSYWSAICIVILQYPWNRVHSAHDSTCRQIDFYNNNKPAGKEKKISACNTIDFLSNSFLLHSSKSRNHVH